MSLLYVAIGDSLTAGYGAKHLSGFVPVYKMASEKILNREINEKVFARNGLTSGEVLKMIQDPLIEDTLRQADIITITVGGNDLINATKKYFKYLNERVLIDALEELKINIKGILKHIYQLKRRVKKRYIIRISNLYNPYPSIRFINKWVLIFNKELYKLNQAKYVKVANIYDDFYSYGRRLLAFGRIHPNDRGYEVIANEFIKLGYGNIDY